VPPDPFQGLTTAELEHLVYDKASNFSYPVICVKFRTLNGDWPEFPMLFDTGSTDIALRPTYAPLFPPGKDDEANAVGASTPQKVKVTKSRIEIFGQQGDCEIVLADVPPNGCFAGLLGRKCFLPFGFGFWERFPSTLRHSQPVTLLKLTADMQ